MTPDGTQNLVETAGRRHGSLDDKAANVLPALLQQRDEVVDGQHNVGDELVLGHANVANGNTKAQNLLKLELDGGLDLGDLGVHVLAVGERGREFTGWLTLATAKILKKAITYPWRDQDPRDEEPA